MAANDEIKSSYDAVVIGTGIGGSCFAYGLAKRGLNVAVVERGDYFKPVVKDFAPMHVTSVRPTGRGRTDQGVRRGDVPAARADFQAVEMEAGVSPGWPIAYADLEPHYCEAEKLLVHGSSDNDADRAAPVGALAARADSAPGPGRWSWCSGSASGRARLVHSARDRLRPARRRQVRALPAAATPTTARATPRWTPRSALAARGRDRRVRVITNAECMRVLTTPDGEKGDRRRAAQERARRSR